MYSEMIGILHMQLFHLDPFRLITKENIKNMITQLKDTAHALVNTKCQ